jgi:flagellar L-ring protein FlgH
MKRPLFLVLMLSLQGCSTYLEETASDAFDPVFPADAPRDDALPTGGIYTASSAGLFASDRRAMRVGDILTVQFVEKFAASKSQTASGSRSSDYSVNLPDVLSTLIPGLPADSQLDNGTSQTFAGRGAAQQSNSLTGRLSVTVVRSLPGGQMEIMGQKRLTLNEGNEYIRLQGIVRPEDISADNVIASDRIAHATIRYVGAGTVADTARPGWLRRGLAAVSPL